MTAPTDIRALLERIKAVRKHEGYGMFFDSSRSRGTPEIRLYGPAAIAVEWLYDNQDIIEVLAAEIAEALGEREALSSTPREQPEDISNATKRMAKTLGADFVQYAPKRAFKLGDRVQKRKGSSWHGTVVGFYSTALTPIGYAIESEREPGSVQIYPESALEAQRP